MQSRMKNPAVIVPEVMHHLVALGGIAKKSGVAPALLNLLYLRASQINACSVCVEMHASDMKLSGETDQRIWAVGAWKESPHFTDAERAALALTEETTRISDRSDAVSDQVWAEVSKYFDENQRASLVLNIALINFWNRTNVATRQVAGGTWK